MLSENQSAALFTEKCILPLPRVPPTVNETQHFLHNPRLEYMMDGENLNVIHNKTKNNRNSESNYNDRGSCNIDCYLCHHRSLKLEKGESTFDLRWREI